VTSMSNSNLQGRTPCAMQNDLEAAIHWLEELSQEIALQKSSSFSLIHFSPHLTIRFMI
jgi:hypothetical protein